MKLAGEVAAWSVEDTIAALLAIVGERGLVLGDDARMRSCDPFRDVPPASGVIVRPATTNECARVLRLCAERGQRIVTHGGRTGVAGGAYAGVEEVVVSLERMSAIELIDPVGQLAVVGAGATLEAVQDAVAEHDMLYPVDLGAKGSATIGGTIATNAGGNRVLRWGMTRANLLGLEAVLPDGTVVEVMNRLVKNNTGYDVKQLFVGSEGTLGIVTRAVLRLVPKPITQMVAFVALPNFDAVIQFLARARRMQILSAFEVMWADYYDLVAASGTGRSPMAPGHPFYVLVEGMGYDEAHDASLFESFLEEAYEAGLVEDAVSATSGRQVADLWLAREGSEVIVREMSPFISFDVSVDIVRAADFVETVKAAVVAEFKGARFVTFGHLGDNNLHLGVHVGPESLSHEHAVEAIVYRIVREFGGALTAEHGIGQFKRDFLPGHVASGHFEVMRRIRDAIDPKRLINREVLF